MQDHLMNTPIHIQTTVESRENGQKIADELLKLRLVACCQLSGPIESRYHWQGEIEHSPEFVLTLKSFSRNFQEICKVIERAHSYDVPEIIATELIHVSPSYLDWMAEEIPA